MCINMVPQSSLPKSLGAYTQTYRETVQELPFHTPVADVAHQGSSSVVHVCAFTRSILHPPVLVLCFLCTHTHGLRGKLPSNPKMFSVRSTYKPISLKVLRNSLESATQSPYTPLCSVQEMQSFKKHWICHQNARFSAEFAIIFILNVF